MKNNSALPFAVGGVVVLILVLLFVLLAQLKPNHDWRYSAEEKGKEPYGLFALEELLKARQGEENFYYTTRKDSLFERLHWDDSLGKVNYLMIESYAGYHQRYLDSLYRFVARGNDAFILSSSYNHALIRSLDTMVCNMSIEDYYADTVRLYRGTEHNEPDNEGFLMYMRDAKDTLYEYWETITTDIEEYYYEYSACENMAALEPLGHLDEETNINFVRIRHGKGYIYLHYTAAAFTNYHLLKQGGLEYANWVFSYMDDSPLIWDAHSKFVPYDYMESTGSDVIDDTPGSLVYILKQPSLRWAWYTMLAAVLIFLIFRARRKQRPIAILHPKENTTLEFSQVIGRLYFQNGQNEKLAVMKWQYFLEHIRLRYHISTNLDTERLVDKISEYSGIKRSHIQEIADLHRVASNYGVFSDEQLIRLHQLMTYFYKHCK